MPIKVVLLRGKMESLEWEHPDLRSAMRRASALAGLHSTTISTNKPNTLVVDASRYYGKAKPAGAPSKNDGLGLVWDEEE